MTNDGLLATFFVADMWCGIQVDRVQEVLLDQDLEPVPMAAAGVVGLLNLRGQVLAAVDLRRRMGLAVRAPDASAIHYIIDLGDGLESLIVDRAGPVVTTAGQRQWPVPETTPAGIADMLVGAYQHPDGLLLVVSLNRVLPSSSQQVR